MDCLRTTNLTMSGSIADTSTVAGSAVNFWVDYSTLMTGFVASLPLVSCEFSPQGFKNVDLYGVELIGYIASNNAVGGNFICDDYRFQTQIFGTFPILGGVAPVGTPFQLNQGVNSNGFAFTKTHSKVNFFTPIKSFSRIVFPNLTFTGYAPTLIGVSQNLNFKYEFDVLLHYRFEGE